MSEPTPSPNRKAAEPGGSAPERILVRGVNWLGDAVMSMPALTRLREFRPRARIILLTPEKLADLWRDHDAVDGVLAFGARESIWSVARQLREAKFDQGVVLPNSPRSALEMWMGGVRHRTGYAARWRRALLTQVVPSPQDAVRMRKRTVGEIRTLVALGEAFASPIREGAHQMHHYLHLVGAMGADLTPMRPRLRVHESERESFLRKFGLHPATGSGALPPVLGMNPGAEYGPAKRWPKERYVEAGVELARQTGCQWLVFGGPADASLAAEIVAGITSALNRQSHGHDQEIPGRNPAPAGRTRENTVVNLAGRTSLRELCAGLQCCRVLLTNDSGPMHVAAAVGTRVVVPFGSTSPEFTGPGLPGDPMHTLLRSGVPCAPCFRRVCPIDFRCMTRITIREVVTAVSNAAAQPPIATET